MNLFYYVDKLPMMNELIVQQQVKRRQTVQTLAQSKSTATQTKEQKPFSYGLSQNSVISQLKQQQPVSVSRYYKKREPELAPLVRVAPPPPPVVVTPPAKEEKAHTKKDARAVKYFDIARVSLIILGCIVVAALIYLNWSRSFFDALRISMLSGEVQPILEPKADNAMGNKLVVYGGLTTPESEIDPDDVMPINMMETFSWETYTVKQGDSLSKIAVDHSISMDAIISSNNISNARLLKAGQILRIPNMDGIPYTVKQGDNLSRISKSMGVPMEAILDANDIQNEKIQPKMVLFIPGAKMRSEDVKLVLGELFIYPLRGRLTSPFGWRNDPISGARRFHNGIDMAANIGTTVKAAMDGKVSTVGVNSVYGKYIIMTHSNGYQTLYAHLNAFSVKQGTYVQQGSKIGESGNTGYSTGPHLHFSIYKNDRAVNPLDFLHS